MSHRRGRSVRRPLSVGTSRPRMRRPPRLVGGLAVDAHWERRSPPLAQKPFAQASANSELAPESVAMVP
jgi:hypothetical protein